ncbi:MAG: hypothetical protein ABWZ42_09755 [Ilumatobacteraceae bacterium]
MTDASLTFAGTFAAIWHAVYSTMRATRISDRGAVSIEHVLWYAAAAISVAVVAAIIWSQVRTTASTPVQSPSAP